MSRMSIESSLFHGYYPSEGQPHIPLPCVAASLPWKFGTGHEAYISYISVSSCPGLVCFGTCFLLWYPVAPELFLHYVVVYWFALLLTFTCMHLYKCGKNDVTHLYLWIREHLTDIVQLFSDWRLDVHVLQLYCGASNPCLYIPKQTSYIKPLGVEMFPWNFSIWRWPHIPLPLVAALLHWNFGTGHEADSSTFTLNSLHLHLFLLLVNCTS